MELPSIKKLVGDGIAGIGNAAANIINAINAPKAEKDQALAGIEAEKNRHLETLLNQANEIEKAYLADVQDARGANAKVQDSSNASWLAKNVAYMIDIFIVILWGVLTIYVVLRFVNIIQAEKGVDFSGVLGIYASVTAVTMTVINFHRGSSKGSDDKQKTIDRMIAK